MKIRLTANVASKREMGRMKHKLLLHFLEGGDSYLNEFSLFYFLVCITKMFAENHINLQLLFSHASLTAVRLWLNN